MDKILEYLSQARVAALNEAIKSRELSLVITKIDEAIMWREADIQLKTPGDDRGQATR